MKILSATCVRNEGPYLLEWIAYYRLIGVTDFIVYSNDCDDGTAQLLDALARQGVIRHVPQSVEDGKSVQWQGLQRLGRDPALAAADWAMFTDVDEFPMIHAGAHRLTDAIAAMPEGTDAIAMPWRLFGAAGVIRFQDSPVTAQFGRSAPGDLSHPIAGRYFKTLFRPAAFQKPGVHRPKRRPSGPVPVWMDGAARPLPEGFAEREAQIAMPSLSVGRDVIELNHYSLRSAEGFLVKVARGLANRRVKRIDLSYWVERNFNTVENTAIHHWSAPLAQEIAALRGLPGVEALHQAACDWHRARFAELVRTEEGYRLFCDCLHASNSAVLPRQVALQLYTLFAEVR